MMKRGCWPKLGIIGTLSACTSVTLTVPRVLPSGNVADPGMIVNANPGNSSSVSVPPWVSSTSRPRGVSIGSR
jgi:hypothetical protein